MARIQKSILIRKTGTPAYILRQGEKLSKTVNDQRKKGERKTVSNN